MKIPVVLIVSFMLCLVVLGAPSVKQLVKEPYGDFVNMFSFKKADAAKFFGNLWWGVLSPVMGGYLDPFAY